MAGAACAVAKASSSFVLIEASNLPDDEETSAELLGPPRVLDTPHHKEPQLDEHDLPSVSMPPA
jgi:hypothetical protein